MPAHGQGQQHADDCSGHDFGHDRDDGAVCRRFISNSVLVTCHSRVLPVVSLVTEPRIVPGK
jgi:hypothetical protein